LLMVLTVRCIHNNLEKTWEKLIMTVRVVVAIKNLLDIIVQSPREYKQRSVLKLDYYIGAQPLTGRLTSGTFTNHMQKSHIFPSLPTKGLTV
ncbi:hypothetical protein MKX01_011617, partial [Papaver californicum]